MKRKRRRYIRSNNDREQPSQRAQLTSAVSAFPVQNPTQQQNSESDVVKLKSIFPLNNILLCGWVWLLMEMFRMRNSRQQISLVLMLLCA